MKTASLLLILIAGTLQAQTVINKTIPFQKGQKVKMEFDYPELIKVSTWEKNEISIQGMVSINGGENDDAFKLQTNAGDGYVSIRNDLNLKGIPHRITVRQGGQTIVFRSKSEWRKYQDEHGKKFDMVNDGVDLDIELEIKVPANAETYVKSVYGLVEIKNFSAPLEVEATYGGVDASLTEKIVGELRAETNYGHIYSDLDTRFDGDHLREEDFHMEVSAKPGVGPRYSFESPYGNVYLRKSH